MPDMIHNNIDRMSSKAEEAYKILRTNIRFCELDREIRTLTVTSCMPGEGKTTTAFNLGISFAEAGMKVLVVDADLRKPMLVKRLGNSDFKGLSNFISGSVSLDEIIEFTGIDRLYYIPSGVKPPNPSELIGSTRFGEFLEKVREQFDKVIVDTPPLGSVIDGALVASQTDGTLIVIRYNAIDCQSARGVKEQLEKVNANILGVILNNVKKGSFEGSGSYYDFYGRQREINRRWLKKLKRVRG